MATQESKSELIETDTSGDVGFALSYTWSVRTPEMINAFTKGEPGVRLESPLIKSSFEFNAEKIYLDWYVIAFPNGNPKQWKESSNCFMITTRISTLPPAKTVKIKSIQIQHLASIPQLNILKSHTDDFNNEKFLGQNTINSHDEINKTIFAKYNVEKKGGFDIHITLRIKSIEFEYKKKNVNAMVNKTNFTSNNYNNNNSTKHEKTMNMILLKLDKIQHQLNQMHMSNQLNQNYNNNNNNSENKLEQWILNMFNGNEEIGKEYIKIIINNQGFDDIDVFCDLNENDLKEIGINKKGHRMKILQKIKEYKDSKRQLLMAAPSVAFDIEQAEGKA